MATRYGSIGEQVGVSPSSKGPSPSFAMDERGAHNNKNFTPSRLAVPQAEEPMSPLLSPNRQIHSELYELDSAALRAHPAFYSEWQENRNTTLQSAVFNLVSTIIGGGVLSLPFVMMKAGVIVGSIMVILTGVACDWSVYILISCSRRTGAQSYKDVAEIAFGPWAGFLVNLSIFSLTFLILIAYGILLRDIVPPVLELAGVFSHPSMKMQNIVMFITVAIVVPVCWLKSLNALRFTSAFSLAAVFVLAMCLLSHLVKRSSDLIVHESIQWFPTSFWDCLFVFPIVCVAFVCHFNVLPIHCDLIVPSRGRIKRVVHTTVALCSLIYMFVGDAGYFVFFSTTKDNIFLNFPADDPATTVGRIALAIAIMLSVPLLALPCQNTFHTILLKPYELYHKRTNNLPPFSPRTQTIMRITEVTGLIVCAIAVSSSVKTVAVVWNFLGSTVGLLVSFVFPPLFYLRIRRPTFQSSMTIPAWVLLVFGVVCMVLCTVEAIKSL